MKITIHRGTNEIGGSCVEIATDNTRIVIDLGMPLVEKDGSDFDFRQYKDLSETELISKGILPDVKGMYNDHLQSIDAFLLSHAHLDHYGFSNFINKKIKFYLSEATHKLINISNLFTSQYIQINNYNHFKSEKKFKIGDIEITPYLMDHSAFDAYAFLIETENKSVFYSGDFRGHGRKKNMFKSFLKHSPKNVDCLILEGTTIGKQERKSKTEDEIQKEMQKIFYEPNKINFVYSSGQNIDRLVTIFKASLKTNKTLIVDVYIASILKSLSKFADVPYPSRKYNIKVLFTKFICDRLSREKHKDLMYQFKHLKISKTEISEHSEKYVMLVKPSIKFDLERISNINNGNFIYSLWKGYMKYPYTKKFIDYLENRDFTIYHIHTGGHADTETLQKLVNSLNPNVIIPIHTFHKNEYEKQFGNTVLVLDDGDILNI